MGAHTFSYHKLEETGSKIFKTTFEFVSKKTYTKYP